MEWRKRMAEKSMKPTVNLYFHELAFAKRQQRVGLEGNYMEHLYRYFEYLMQYTSTVDPEFELPYNFVLKQYADVVDIPPDPNVPTLVFLPLNLDILRFIQNNKPDLVPALQQLDSQKNIHLCFDFAQESAYPGNFCKTNSPLSLCTETINFQQWNLFCFSTLIKNKPNTNNFKNIFYGISYTATWLFKVVEQETPWIGNPDLIYTHKGKSGPIRYFVPNNEFRPSRAQTIVAMHDKDMLNDAEWNMNSFKDWDMHTNSSTYLGWLSNEWTDRYLELFGKAPRTMSYPWNKTFNLKHPPAEFWPDDLLDMTYIYIATETFADYNNEGAHKDVQDFISIEVTEKIFKGYIYGMPMFIMGRPGSQASYKEIGFDTFEDMMSVPYDHIADRDERCDAMLESAKSFPTATPELIERLHVNKRHAMKKETLWNMLDMSPEKDLLKKLLDN